MSDLLEKI